MKIIGIIWFIGYFVAFAVCVTVCFITRNEDDNGGKVILVIFGTMGSWLTVGYFAKGLIE